MPLLAKQERVATTRLPLLRQLELVLHREPDSYTSTTTSANRPARLDQDTVVGATLPPASPFAPPHRLCCTFAETHQIVRRHRSWIHLVSTTYRRRCFRRAAPRAARLQAHHHQLRLR